MGFCDLNSALGIEGQVFVGQGLDEKNEFAPSTAMDVYGRILSGLDQTDIGGPSPVLGIFNYTTPADIGHPVNTLYNYTGGVELEFSCVSQLNLSIMLSWYDVIHGVFP